VAIDKQNKRFSKLLTREVFPLVVMALSVIAYFKYKPEI